MCIPYIIIEELLNFPISTQQKQVPFVGCPLHIWKTSWVWMIDWLIDWLIDWFQVTKSSVHIQFAAHKLQFTSINTPHLHESDHTQAPACYNDTHHACNFILPGLVLIINGLQHCIHSHGIYSIAIHLPVLLFWFVSLISAVPLPSCRCTAMCILCLLRPICCSLLWQ